MTMSAVALLAGRWRCAVAVNQCQRARGAALTSRAQ